MIDSIKRMSKRDKTQMIPQPKDGEDGLVTVDVTWGEIQPVRAAEGVQKVGELEVIEHLEKGLPVIDVRASGTRYGVGIPGAKAFSMAEITDHIDQLDRTVLTIFFCNGPQCPQSPKTIHKLLDAGYPADKIGYYRGGMHNWITLGLPVEESGE